MKSIIKSKISKVAENIDILQSKISIWLDRHEYHAGEEIHAKIFFHMKRPIVARRIEASLILIEKAKSKTYRVMDHHDYQEEKELGIPRSTHLRSTESEFEKTTVLERKAIGGEREYLDCKIEAVFKLPKNAKPTSHVFGSDLVKRKYLLAVKMDIPLAIDRHASREVIVK